MSRDVGGATGRAITYARMSAQHSEASEIRHV